MTEYCAKRIYQERDVLGRPCLNKIKVQVSGDSWCAIHNPEAVERRKAKADARYAITSQRCHACKRPWATDKLAATNAALLEALDELREVTHYLISRDQTAGLPAGNHTYKPLIEAHNRACEIVAAAKGGD